MGQMQFLPGAKWRRLFKRLGVNMPRVKGGTTLGTHAACEHVHKKKVRATCQPPSLPMEAERHVCAANLPIFSDPLSGLLYFVCASCAAFSKVNSA